MERQNNEKLPQRHVPWGGGGGGGGGVKNLYDTDKGFEQSKTGLNSVINWGGGESRGVVKSTLTSLNQGQKENA